MNKTAKNYLTIVVPCYNEENNLNSFYQEVLIEIEMIKEKINPNLDYSLVFVNDGSGDGTIRIAQQLQRKDKKIEILDFSRNFGKEATILAGLQKSKEILDSLGGGDGATILIDADLQDPISFIHLMYQSFFEGYDMVYAQRINRSGENFFRSLCGNMFYRIVNFFGGVTIPNGSRDYRILSYGALEALLQMQEYHRFSKAMFEWIGFEKKCLEYEYIPRQEGQSGWNFWKLFKYAIEGFVSFFYRSIKTCFYFGIFGKHPFNLLWWIYSD